MITELQLKVLNNYKSQLAAAVGEQFHHLACRAEGCYRGRDPEFGACMRQAVSEALDARPHAYREPETAVR